MIIKSVSVLIISFGILVFVAGIHGAITGFEPRQNPIKLLVAGVMFVLSGLLAWSL